MGMTPAPGPLTPPSAAPGDPFGPPSEPKARKRPGPPWQGGVHRAGAHEDPQVRGSRRTWAGSALDALQAGRRRATIAVAAKTGGTAGKTPAHART
jgi:hypothetical protein